MNTPDNSQAAPKDRNSLKNKKQSVLAENTESMKSSYLQAIPYLIH